jgi:hypothetical protein
MPIAILVLALVAYGYALAAYPEYRMPGLVLGAAMAIGLGFYFWRTDPESARTAIRIAPEELTLDQLALDRVARGATLNGRVLNGSERFRLREMTLALRLHDCPEADMSLDRCPVIGESRAIARPDVPAGQIRGFTAHFAFANLPAVTGALRYEWTVETTRATE